MLFLTSQAAQANVDRLVLPCEWVGESAISVGAPQVSVVKLRLDRLSPAKFQIEIRPMSPGAKPRTLALKARGTGDEGYSEYRVKRSNRFQLYSVAISDDFTWAEISDDDGSDAYKCKKP